MFGPRSMRPSPALLVAILALLVAMGGTSYAAVTLSKNSVASKHIKNGQVKRADLKASAVNSAKVKDGSLAARDFRAGELPEGPRGDTGPAGPRGDTGPRGVAGPTDTVTVVAKSPTIAPGNYGVATAHCPAGMQAVGGGIQPHSITLSVTGDFPVIGGANISVLATGQHAAATAWRGTARNDGSGTYQLTVAAVCAG